MALEKLDTQEFNMELSVEIKEKLEAFELKCGDNFSLYRGKTGLCMAYFILSAACDNPAYKTKAHELLDELSENMADVQKLHFAAGIAGIGWAVEWLVQNKYIDANTDDILEDLDDEIYKAVVYEKSPDLSIANGTLGKAMYFYRRLLAQNPTTNRYRTICNQECLVLLTDEINEVMLNEESGWLCNNHVPTPDQLTQIAQSIIFLSKLTPFRINIEVCKKVTSSIISFIKNCCEQDDFFHSEKSVEKLHLLYANYMVAIGLKNDALIKDASNYYSRYLSNIDTIGIIEPFEFYIRKKLAGLLNKDIPGKTYSNIAHIFDVMNLISGPAKINDIDWDEAWGL
ncbi:lanthionine synthetase LanC family protein [Mucilaginibacter sp. OK098]|uniref:lanthionine synthetase LanC family protein n=1 Tax=Mucilaginibacter sp. OK098 TaxID=1855297 RepID=UPI0009144F90|nr:lanthionine synthetase LanC family protein [Mucilaginibacter sp. OK098]SHM81774.1 Lanthionine synthetase C-like protein [Mucilaginibacter sp. OK098]